MRLSSGEEKQGEESKDDGVSDLNSDGILEKSVQKLASKQSSSTSTTKRTFKAPQNCFRKKCRKGTPKRSPLM